VPTTQPLDRRHARAVGVRRRHQARVDRDAVDEDGARAALPFAASLLGPRQPAVLAQHVEQTLQRMHVEAAPCPVEHEVHPCHLRALAFPPCHLRSLAFPPCHLRSLAFPPSRLPTFRSRLPALPPSSLAAVITLSGVAGISRISNPACRSALTTAGAGPSIGISPTPLAPNGPCLYGFSSIVTASGGVSSVVGMM